MKLSVLQENLDKALTTVSRLVQSNNSLPVLANILIKTTDGRLELQSTNLELAISYKIGAKIEKPGSLSVPAKLFSDLIHSTPNDKIQLVALKDNLEIHTNQLNSTLNGISASDFPHIPDVETKKKFKVSTKDFITGLEYVLTSVSLDESRPVLAGVYCKVENNVLVFAATDSYRLSQYTIKASGLEDMEIIIPHRTIQELIRIVKTEDISEITIGITDTEIVFYTDSITLTSQLIDGSYPDYTKIIPKSSPVKIEISKDDLVSGLKIASLFSRENAHTIQLSVSKDKLSIISEGAQIGKNISSIPVKNTGEAQEISLNARYLIDTMSSIVEKTVVITMQDKLDPCVVSAQKNSKDNFHIIMPLRS